MASGGIAAELGAQSCLPETAAARLVLCVRKTSATGAASQHHAALTADEKRKPDVTHACADCDCNRRLALEPHPRLFGCQGDASGNSCSRQARWHAPPNESRRETCDIVELFFTLEMTTGTRGAERSKRRYITCSLMQQTRVGYLVLEVSLASG